VVLTPSCTALRRCLAAAHQCRVASAPGAAGSRLPPRQQLLQHPKRQLCDAKFQCAAATINLVSCCLKLFYPSIPRIQAVLRAIWPFLDWRLSARTCMAVLQFAIYVPSSPHNLVSREWPHLCRDRQNITSKIALGIGGWGNLAAPRPGCPGCQTPRWQRPWERRPLGPQVRCSAALLRLARCSAGLQLLLYTISQVFASTTLITHDLSWCCLIPLNLPAWRRLGLEEHSAMYQYRRDDQDKCRWLGGRGKTRGAGGGGGSPLGGLGRTAWSSKVMVTLMNPPSGFSVCLGLKSSKNLLMGTACRMSSMKIPAIPEQAMLAAA